MKIKLNKIAKVAASLTVLGSLAFIGQAQAAGTAAGTSINNTANLNFTIAGIAQTPIASNTVSFVVDNRVNLAVSASNPAGLTPAVVAGGTGYTYRFTVTNTGNSAQDFLLAVNGAGFAGQSFNGRPDNFDMSTCAIFVDSNNSGTYKPASDTAVYIDELAANAFKYVYAVCSAPVGIVNGDASIIGVEATAAAGGSPGVQGAVLTQSTGADTAGIDIVFGDPAGSDDVAKDGKVSARGGFYVSAPVLTVVKTNVPICDPLNFNAFPKNIPGAYVRYSIEVSNANTASASAILGTITDTIDINTLSLDPNLGLAVSNSCVTPESFPGRSIKATCTNGTRTCVSAPVYRTGTIDGDGADFDPATGTWTVNMANLLGAQTGYLAGELKPNEKVKIEFSVIVK